jgi:poly-D-alanine transfer protein DltD
MIPKIGNNNNNTISINLFLNQECKNAMNLTDFIDQLQVSLEDLNYSKNNGFVAGVTNIFTKQLKDMDPKDRPIHCSDSKRLQFYIKDDDKWAKDNNSHKIDQTIHNIKLKQTYKLTEWEKLHPNYQNSPESLHEWQMILAIMTEDNTSENPGKIKTALKRNIADAIPLKDAMV